MSCRYIKLLSKQFKVGGKLSNARVLPGVHKSRPRYDTFLYLENLFCPQTQGLLPGYDL